MQQQEAELQQGLAPGLCPVRGNRKSAPVRRWEGGVMRIFSKEKRRRVVGRDGTAVLLLTEREFRAHREAVQDGGKDRKRKPWWRR